jgi:hypothetical protein
MKFVRLMRILAAGVLLVGGVGGCGGSGKFAKVSGVVTLDGVPYKNAIVSFQPLGDGNPNPGRGSTGLTDENGRYTLTTDDGHTGAVIGKHRIRIRTRVNDAMNVAADPSLGTPDGVVNPPRGKKPEIEYIPEEWFADHTTKEYVVPPEGTDKADFAITRKKK